MAISFGGTKGVIDQGNGNLVAFGEWTLVTAPPDGPATPLRRRLRAVIPPGSRTPSEVRRCGRNEPCLCGSGKKFKLCCKG